MITHGSFLPATVPSSFVFALAQVVFISALELLKPWPLKVIIDHVLTGTPVPWNFARGWSSQILLLLACAGLVLFISFWEDCASSMIIRRSESARRW